MQSLLHIVSRVVVSITRQFTALGAGLAFRMECTAGRAAEEGAEVGCGDVDAADAARAGDVYWFFPSMGQAS